jgi:hypothetical protein
MLKSPLSQSYSSQLKIWMPPTWSAVPGPDGTTCNTPPFSYSYNGNREGVKNQFSLPGGASFVEIPSGTVCQVGHDAFSDLGFIVLNIELLVDDGLDYAFEFEATNPQYNLPVEENFWRFETYQFGVILHLQLDIPGYELEQIQEVTVTPGDTTAVEPMNRMAFYMMSNKDIPGGSTILIRAPNGFEFNCAFFSTDTGLSSTTTCLPRNEGQDVEFTIDSQDPKQPFTPWTIFVYVKNPEFTPQDNWWTFEISNFLDEVIDRRDFYPSFDITRKVLVDIYPYFPYIGQRNPLRVTFAQSTIMNQADRGNELVLTAPNGYIFPQNCSNFKIRVSGAQDGSATSSFPPPGVTCTGFGNASVVVRLPDGVGLFIGNYTVEVDIDNPNYAPNETDPTWIFITRVRNEDIGQKIVDANVTVPGFPLYVMTAAKSTEGSGAVQIRPPVCSFVLLLLALAWRRAW